MRRALPAAALAAALTLAAVPPLTAAPASAAPVPLPVVRAQLPPDEPCTGASGETARTAPWPVRTLQLSRAWRQSKGAGVTVAVVDTGVGVGAPALAGRVRTLASAGEDCVGHGTFAAGLIAGAPLPGVGAVGVAPEARVLAVRCTDERGTATPVSVATAIRAAATAGAKVIYVSRALPTGRAELTGAVAYARAKDALVVAPAAPDALPDDPRGESRPPATWYWPASAPGALSVLDYGPDGSRPAKAPTAVGADLAAPGGSVVGPGPRGAGHYIGSGSSLAAAHVAGAAALVRARHPELTATQVRDRLTATGYPASPPRLDPYAALTAVLDGASGSAPRPAPARMPAPAPHEPRHRALVVAAAGAGLIILVAAAAAIIPRGRSRHWRPPTQPPTAPPNPPGP